MKPQEFALKIRPLKRSGRICRAMGCMNEGKNAVRTTTLNFFGRALLSTRFYCDKCCPQEGRAA